MAASAFLSKYLSSLASPCRNSISDDRLYFVRGSDELVQKKSTTFELSYRARFGTVDASYLGRRESYEIKNKTGY